jgi:cell wall assembly regulator SMI1
MERTAITKYGVKLIMDQPPAEEGRVSVLEAKLGRRLPDEYREFLLLYNGGRPVPSAFQFAANKGSDTDSLVNWFLSLHDGEVSNLEKVARLMNGRIPSETLPIARDPFGNLILLGLHGDVRGKIYFWDHEREPDDQPDWSNIDLIADDFDRFMRGLRRSLSDPPP